MKEPYDPTKAPLGPMGSRSNRRGLMIQHNRKVLAKRMKAMKLTPAKLEKPKMDET
jgi:hypothetical protein